MGMCEERRAQNGWRGYDCLLEMFTKDKPCEEGGDEG
jgi:hypothetical protein